MTVLRSGGRMQGVVRASRPVSSTARAACDSLRTDEWLLRHQWAPSEEQCWRSSNADEVKCHEIVSGTMPETTKQYTCTVTVVSGQHLEQATVLQWEAIDHSAALHLCSNHLCIHQRPSQQLGMTPSYQPCMCGACLTLTVLQQP